MKLWGRNFKGWIWLSPKVASSNGSQLYSFYFSFDRKVLSLWLTELKMSEEKRYDSLGREKEEAC